MIEILDLVKNYHSKKKVEIITNALDGLNIKFNDRGLIGIIGKSGCGKTTLLNMIAGIDNPTSGKILINGENINCYKESECDIYRNYYVSLIFSRI